MDFLPEDIIKYNFFNLSYSGQIKIYDLYLSVLSSQADFNFFKNTFEKYMKIIDKFICFKTNFYKFNDEERKELRNIIFRCRSMINLDNSVEYVYQDCCYLKISDSYIDQYVKQFFSYTNEIKNLIALDLANYYSYVEDYDFDKILKLCNGNRDLFNDEIKKLSSDFYSLYLIMSTVDRMKYIWHLSNFDSNVVESDISDDLSEHFSNDNKYIKPVLSNNLDIDKIKKLSKFFKMDN